MKNIFAYLLVGVVSAATTFGLINYTKSDNNQTVSNLVEDAKKDENTNSHFATYDYKSSGTEMPDFTKAAEKSVHAVVSIKNYGVARKQSMRGGNLPFNDPFFDQFFDQFFKRDNRRQQRQPDEEVPTGAGSGVIISKDGYIVTNNHVIDGATKLEVTLDNQQTYSAKLVGTDPNTDIALIKIDEDNLPFLSFFNSDNIKVGEWVLAIGNPLGLNSTVTAGIVSAKGRNINILGRNGERPIESFIQTDAAINPGNSGGALVNTNGHLVGINTAISSQTGSYVGYGFAVPSNLVKKVVNDIKNYGMVQRGFVGVSALDLSNEMMVRNYNRENEKDIKTGEGVMVTGLMENGGALEAGIEEGDIIRKVDGEKINSFSALSLAIGRKSPGDKVNIELYRDGKKRNYQVELKDEQGNAKIRSLSDLSALEKMGAKFQPLTEKQKIRYGIDKGVLVTEVKRNSKLANIGVSDGYIILEINKKEVDSSKDIEKILKNYKGNVSIKFVDRYGRIYTQGFKI